MNFCSRCGNPVEERVPPDDNRPRFVCLSCGTIHYINPKIVVCCIPFHEDRVLLCRRAIEPRRGLWTVPGGFMENGERIEEGALRETREEANARAEILYLQTVYSIPDINQVHMIFVARLLDLDFAPGSESLETRLFSKEEIPWNELAFLSAHFALSHYFESPRESAPHFGFHRR